MKTLFKTLPETNYDVLNEKRFLFQESQKAAESTESTEIQKNVETSETLKASKADQIECKKSCLKNIEESELPDYSTETVRYKKETVQSNITNPATTVERQVSTGPVTEIQKYIVNCTNESCARVNKMSTLSGAAQELGFSLKEGALVSVNGAPAEPIDYTEKVTRTVASENLGENPDGETCDDIKITFNKSNFDRVRPGQHVYVAEGVLHISDTKPGNTITVKETQPATTSTVNTIKYLKENTDGNYSEIQNPNVSFDANGLYEETTYFKDGESTTQAEYEAGLKLAADTEAVKALTDDDVESYLENKTLQGGADVTTADIEGKTTKANKAVETHTEHLTLINKYQDVLKKEFARTFDTKTGIVGLFNSVLKIENSLVKKMEKAGIDKAQFEKIYTTEQKNLQAEHVQIDSGTESNLKEKYDLTQEEFDAALQGKFDKFSKVQYKSWKEDLANVAVGMLFGGINIPVIHVNTGREASAMDLNAITEGKYSDNLEQIVTLQKEATEDIMNMGAVKSALQGGFEAKAYNELAKNAAHFTVNAEDTVTNLYEGEQQFLDAREDREASQTKEQKNVQFKLLERIFGDSKANKTYKRATQILAAKTIAELPKKQLADFEAKAAGMGEQEKNLLFEQSKLEALKTIKTESAAELAEDSIRPKKAKRLEGQLHGRKNYLAELDRMIDVRERTITNMDKATLMNAVVSGEGSDQAKYWKAAVLNMLTDYESQDGLNTYLSAAQKTALAGTEMFYNATDVTSKMAALDTLQNNEAFKLALSEYSQSLSKNKVDAYLAKLSPEDRANVESCLGGDCAEVVSYDGKSVTYIRTNGVPITVPVGYLGTETSSKITSATAKIKGGGAQEFVGEEGLAILKELTTNGVIEESTINYVTENFTKEVSRIGVDGLVAGAAASIAVNKLTAKEGYHAHNVNIKEASAESDTVAGAGSSETNAASDVAIEAGAGSTENITEAVSRSDYREARKILKRASQEDNASAVSIKEQYGEYVKTFSDYAEQNPQKVDSPTEQYILEFVGRIPSDTKVESATNVSESINIEETPMFIPGVQEMSMSNFRDAVGVWISDPQHVKGKEFNVSDEFATKFGNITPTLSTLKGILSNWPADDTNTIIVKVDESGEPRFDVKE